MARRVLLVNWIYDVNRSGAFSANGQSDSPAEIAEVVRDAVGRLQSTEREFVHLYWFEGRSLDEISRLLARRPHILDGIRRRCLRKLRSLLSTFAADRFGIESPRIAGCVICNHPCRREIDAVLRARRPEETWGSVRKSLEARFGLRIPAPQTMISHIEYHT